MPYFISNHAEDCAGWATVKEDNSVITCHKTKQDAIDHMVAISIAEEVEPGGELKRSIAEEDLEQATATLNGESDETEVEQISNNPTTDTELDEEPVIEQNSTKDKWFRAAGAILARIEPLTEAPMPESREHKFETRVSHADIELREVQGSNGMTFEGYAAVFNSPSQPIGGQFTEYVAPGAFKRSLQARNDIKLLWNHDTGQVLGSTRAGTLTLIEDARGLKAVAQLPDTQLGRDTAVLLKRGDVANMSFGFSVPKNGDSWSEDYSERTLNSVRLHEVSIVGYPAYLDTTASVRAIDQNVLADSLFKLEQGQDLTTDESALIKSVVDKLTEEIEEAPAEAILGLKQKKLELLAKRI